MTPATRLLAEEARRRFAALVARPEAALDVAQAALLVAAEERPGLDVEHYRALLLELGVRARERMRERMDAPVAALNHFIFNELGFAGNSEHYYDPRNSLLSYVLDARRGIPITLALVYIELGRRAGLAAQRGTSPWGRGPAPHRTGCGRYRNFRPDHFFLQFGELDATVLGNPRPPVITAPVHSA